MRFRAFALFMLCVWLLALYEHLHGNPTAINALIGIAITSPILCAFAWMEYREWH